MTGGPLKKGEASKGVIMEERVNGEVKIFCRMWSKTRFFITKHHFLQYCDEKTTSGSILGESIFTSINPFLHELGQGSLFSTSLNQAKKAKRSSFFKNGHKLLKLGGGLKWPRVFGNRANGPTWLLPWQQLRPSKGQKRPFLPTGNLGKKGKKL